MIRPTLSLLFLLALPFYTKAQCDVTVDVPSDITICADEDVYLEGIINGTESCFNWISDQGYFNDSETDPTVFVNTNTTFTFTAYGSDPGPNLIVNGDFENGDDGSFDTDYTVAIGNCVHGAGFLGCEGFYEIMPDPSVGHTNFDPCAPMDALQMIVNGAGSLQLIWCQDVDVEENKKYEFSAWGQSVNPGSPAQLQFSIDGDQIGNILSLSTSTCSWDEIKEYWVAPSTTSVQICVTNQNTATGGNDFAIDDIFFGELCSEEKSFTVTVGNLSIDPNLPDELSCSNTQVELNLNPDGLYPPFDFVWTNQDNNIIDDSGDGDVFVYMPGIYLVELTDQFGCTLEHEFDVYGDLTFPTISLDPVNPIIYCDETYVEVYNDFHNFNLDYEWELEGVLVSDDPVLEASEPGFYELTVTDVTNGCTSTASVFVNVDDEIPEIEASFSNPIDCNNSSSELLLQTNENLLSTEWYDESGALITNTTVTTGGMYFVSVVGLNGCTAEASVNLPEIEFDPQLTVNDPETINCNNSSSLLSVNFNGNLNLDWSGPNLFTASGNDIVVDNPGTYFLNASNDAGCSLDLTIEIFGDLMPPVFQLAPVGVLDCDIQSIPLSVNASNPDYVYLWTLPNGSQQAGQTINASAAGDYSVTVTALNGCTNTTMLTLQPAGNLPTINLDVQNIDCINSSTILNATGNYNSLQWSDANGPITDLAVTEQGWYYAFADNGGGCDVTDSIYLSVDTITPQQNIVAPIINCDGTEDLLFNSLDAEYIYQWLLPDGSISFEDTLIASQAGNYNVTISSANGCATSNSIFVDSDVELPEYTVDGLLSLNCNNNQYELDIDSISDLTSIILTDPFGNTQNNSLTIENGGMHSIEITGANGCVDIFEFDVPIDTLSPSPIVQSTNINCINTSASLTITNQEDNQLYVWSSASGTSEGTSFDSNEIGIVELTATDTLTGCSTNFEFEVLADLTIPTLTYFVPQLTCVAQEAEIMLFPDGDYKYEWILPNLEIDTGLFLMAQDTGNYQLFLTAQNGCTNEYLIHVSGNIEIPEFEVVPPDPLTCNNETTIIQIVSDELLAGYTATLEDASFSFGNGELVTDQAGEWSVQVTAPSGCTATADFQIIVDTLPANPEIIVQNIDCQNTTGLMTIQNENQNSSYLWTDSQGEIWPMSSFIPTNEEFVYLSETPSNGCIGIDSAFVTIDTISPTLEISSTLIDCTNLFSTLEVIEPNDSIDYYWVYENEIIESQVSFETDQLGSYTAFAFNPSNNCEAGLSLDVNADPNIPTAFDFSIADPPCGENEFIIGDFIVEGGNGPYVYSIGENSTIPVDIDSPGVLTEGINHIQIQDSLGCVLDTMITLMLPTPVEAMLEEDILVIWANDTLLQLGLNKPLEEIESIQWTPSVGLSCDDCPNPVANLTETTTYQVLVTDINGCEDLAEIRIEVFRIISVYLPTVFTPDNIDNNLFFPFSTEQHITNVDNFYIFDRWGNRVFSNSNFLPNDPSAGWDGTINGAKATPGVYAYILEIFYADGTSEIIADDVTLLR